MKIIPDWKADHSECELWKAVAWPLPVSPGQNPSSLDHYPGPRGVQEEKAHCPQQRQLKKINV